MAAPEVREKKKFRKCLCQSKKISLLNDTFTDTARRWKMCVQKLEQLLDVIVMCVVKETNNLKLASA